MAEFLDTITKLESRASYADWADRVERALRLAGWWEATQFKPLAKSSMSSSALASYRQWERTQSTLNDTEQEDPSSDFDIMDWVSELEPVPGCKLRGQDEVLVHHPRNSQALLAIKATLSNQINARYPGFKSASRLWQAINDDYVSQPTTPTHNTFAAYQPGEVESIDEEEEEDSDDDDNMSDSIEKEILIVPENSLVRRYGAGGPVGLFFTISELYHAMSWGQMIPPKKLNKWAHRIKRKPEYLLPGSHKILESLQELAFGKNVTRMMESQDQEAGSKTARARLATT